MNTEYGSRPLKKWGVVKGDGSPDSPSAVAFAESVLNLM